jgi:glycyl-tRNA synthetase
MGKNKTQATPGDERMQKVVSLCKRRGYIFQSSEIYGGLNSCWDYGPLGVELKNNIKHRWWKEMVHSREDVVGLDSSVLMHPGIWKASGHVDGFTDPMVDCKECRRRFRDDDFEGEVCPVCGGELTEQRQFNLMFRTFMGPLEDQASVVFLRPETAQGIYVNFLNVQTSSRKKIPFGIAQIGKAFRNEITPGNFIFRMREFEQMEMQYFIKPGTGPEWLKYWMEKRMAWYVAQGIRSDRLHFHEHGPDDLAHYARAAYDIEYDFPFGRKELEGIHDRGDFDLSRHEEHSGKKLTYIDPAADERFIPHIVETSAGVDRSLLVCLVDAYEEEELEKDTRVVLRLSPQLAPIKAAIFPLVKRDGMPEIARGINDDLTRRGLPVFYDETGAVGRRYRRQDEAGTPFGITVDSDTLTGQTVTVRDRDTMAQERVAIDALHDYLVQRINSWTPAAD